MLIGPPSDRQEEESKKARNKKRKLTLDEIAEAPPPAPDETPLSKTTREERTDDWRRDLYNAD